MRHMIMQADSTEPPTILLRENDSHAACRWSIVHTRCSGPILGLLVQLAYVAQRLTRRPESFSLPFSRPHPLSGNTVIGGGRRNGGQTLGDDKRLKKLIILVLSSSSYEEDSSTSHAARCVFDPLLAHDQAAKWSL